MTAGQETQGDPNGKTVTTKAAKAAKAANPAKEAKAARAALHYGARKTAAVRKPHLARTSVPPAGGRVWRTARSRTSPARSTR